MYLFIHYTHDRERKLMEVNSSVHIPAIIHGAIIGLYDFLPLLCILYFLPIQGILSLGFFIWYR